MQLLEAKVAKVVAKALSLLEEGAETTQRSNGVGTQSPESIFEVSGQAWGQHVDATTIAEMPRATSAKRQSCGAPANTLQSMPLCCCNGGLLWARILPHSRVMGAAGLATFKWTPKPLTGQAHHIQKLA